MPRRNGIKQFLTALILLGAGTYIQAQEYPLVIGYERFHSEEPTIEGGRILFNELGCIQCHHQETALPERKGPTLDGILKRSHPDYVARFIKNPSDTKPGTTMPQMHLSENEVEAVVHYLASLKSDKKIPDAFRFVNAERGMALYHDLGCVSCHSPSPDFHPAEGIPDESHFTYPSIPLKNLNEKYDFNSLSAFLYKPHDYWPEGRMPQFQLEREDGGDLTAFLLNHQSGDSTEYPSIETFASNKTLVAMGREVVATNNCAACHAFPSSERITAAPKVSIGSDAIYSNEHPDYSLSENQIASLQLFLKKGENSNAPALTHLQTMNCLACHDRDTMGGPDSARKVYFSGNHDLGDSGKYPPPLTGVGKKLKADWLEAALRGEKKIRPYIQVQMPDFRDAITGLAHLLSRDDQNAGNIELPQGNLEIGRKLLGTQGGLNCITCHNWGDRKSLGIRALDLSTLSERLRPEWFHDYLVDPAAYRPNTLMPSFWPKGIASNTEILDGNTAQQIAAIYAFSESGEGLPEGFPEENTTDYEIVPLDRVVVQRSFVEGVGAHGVLVGFPEGIHLAFNGKSGEPAILWKGRFFDAYRTWYSRFPEFEKPLGEELAHWPPSQMKDTRKYRGYRLDSAGIPEFILSLNDSDLFERFIPSKNENGQLGMQRVIRYTRESQIKDPRLRHPESVNTTELQNDDPMTRSFFYQW